MYELIQAGENTWYIDCPTKIGIYRLNEKDVCIIDSGNDKDAGRRILKILGSQNWELKMIINTHSHADHIGGNNFLQKRTGCSIYTSEVESSFTRYPILESSMVYSAYPSKIWRNKFLLAEASNCTDVSDAILPDGMEIIPLPGHSINMIGVKTPDGVCFMADCVSGEYALTKYHIFYIYNVGEYLSTLDSISKLDGKLFIPSHTPVCDDIRPLAEFNRKNIFEICDTVSALCKSPAGFDDILKGVFDKYGLTLDAGQYVIAGSTIRAYLSYLCDTGVITTEVIDNKFCWKLV